MGQYYMSMLTKGNKKQTIVTKSWAFDNGSKLLEHSYYTNSYIFNTFIRMFNNPWRVAWIGDYSSDMFTAKKDDIFSQRWDCMEANETPVEYINRVSCGFIKTADDFLKYYNKCWNDNASKYHDTTLVKPINELWSGKFNHETKMWEDSYDPFMNFVDELVKNVYLINKTRKEYISLKRWFNECVGNDYDHDNKRFAFHPLPLLTACGNGLGGGDFHQGDRYNCKYIGYWAFNNLYFSNEPPKNYKEAEYLYDDFEATPF